MSLRVRCAAAIFVSVVMVLVTGAAASADQAPDVGLLDFDEAAFTYDSPGGALPSSTVGVSRLEFGGLLVYDSAVHIAPGTTVKPAGFVAARATLGLAGSATSAGVDFGHVYDSADSFGAPSGPMVDFAHGTSPGSATSIVNGGLDEAGGAAASAGGRYASPGSFHTFPISPTDTRGLQLAYEMGLRHGDDACVVVCRIPQSTYDDLLRNGDVLIEPIPGVDVPQVVFGPDSFGPINQNAVWVILKPGG